YLAALYRLSSPAQPHPRLRRYFPMNGDERDNQDWLVVFVSGGVVMVKRLFGVLAAVAVGMLAGALPASAAASYTLFGDATRVHPGFASHTAIQLRSVGTGSGGIDFKVPSGMTFGQIQNLSTD